MNAFVYGTDGGMNQFVEIKTTMVTPEMASEWLATDPGDARGISVVRLKLYADAMRRGEWDGAKSETIILSEKNGHVIVVNGRHRLTALVQAGAIVPLLVEFRSGCDTHSLYVDRGARRRLHYVLNQPMWLTELASLACRFDVNVQPGDSMVLSWCDVLRPLFRGTLTTAIKLSQVGVRLGAALACAEIGDLAIERYDSMFSGSIRDEVTTVLFRHLTAQSTAYSGKDRQEIVYRSFAGFAASKTARMPMQMATSVRMVSDVVDRIKPRRAA